MALLMDLQRFIDLFGDDGVIHAGLNSYRGMDLGHGVVFTKTGSSIALPDRMSEVNGQSNA